MRVWAGIIFLVWVVGCMGGAASAQPTPQASNEADAGRLTELSRSVRALEISAEAAALREKEADRKRQEDDLNAQQAMASSAQDLSNLTEYQLYIGLLTLIGLAATTYFTRKSVLHSQQLVEDNRKYSETQLKAYLGIDHVEVCDFEVGEMPSIKVTYKNFGSTPAQNLKVWSQREVLSSFPTEHEPTMGNKIEWKDKSDVPPGGTSSTRFFVASKLSQEVFDQYKDRKKSICLFLIVSYTDVFGETDVLRFAEIRSGKSLYRSRMNYSLQTYNHVDIPKADRFSIRSLEA